MQIPTKAEWVDWKNSNTTQFFLAALNRKREHIKEGLAEGQYQGKTELDVFVGQAQAIKDVILYVIDSFEYLEREEDA